MEEKILEIIRSYETTTYPRGVGSVFRCVESHNYSSIAKSIKNLLISEELSLVGKNKKKKKKKAKH